MSKYKIRKIVSAIVTIVVLVSIFGFNIPNLKSIISSGTPATETASAEARNIDVTDYANTAISFTTEDGNQISIPQFDGSSYTYTVNDNTPYFTTEDLTFSGTYVTFSNLDDYGRAQVASAVLGLETMQTHERGDISDIHPSGWWEAKASDVNVNRCHLIGNQLGGDQTDTSFNMVTGARHFNTPVMTDYENPTADYIEKTGNHVRYRVTPVFENNDSTCHGVLMEAESIEDGGAGLKFCVYCYNIQPGYVCDYQIGEWSKIDG